MDWVKPFAEAIQQHGWAVTDVVVPPSLVQPLIEQVSTDGEDRGGKRNLLDLDCIRDLARSPAVRAAAQAVLGTDCFAVRGLLFDKTPEANWKVPWHQDVMIAVAEQAEVEGYGPWSTKAGVPHVQPPVPILEQMLALRIHLDECGSENGPLRLLPGSHTMGMLEGAQIDQLVASLPNVFGLAAKGAILGFRPLMLHASSPALQPHHRRVIHLEYAAAELANGLRWRWRV